MAKANTKKTSPEDFLSTAEVAAELGLGPARVNVLLNTGRLPAMRVGKVWIVRRADLEAVRVRKNGRPRKNPDVKKKRP